MLSSPCLRRANIIRRHLQQCSTNTLCSNAGNLYYMVHFLYNFDHNSQICPNMFAGQYDYDLVVIGGGSGGLSCAKEGSCYLFSFWKFK